MRDKMNRIVMFLTLVLTACMSIMPGENEVEGKGNKPPEGFSLQGKDGDYFRPEERRFGDSAIETILDGNPTTVQEIARAAKMIYDLGRPEVSDKLYEKALKSKMSDSDLLSAAKENGVNYYILIKNVQQMPHGIKFAEKVLDAVKRRDASDDIMRETIRQLADTREYISEPALREVDRRGDEMLPEMFRMMSDQREKKEVRTAIMQVLCSRGNKILPHLRALLDSGDKGIRSDVVRLLYSLKTRETLDLLYYVWATGEKKTESETLRAVEDAVWNLTKQEVNERVVVQGYINILLRENRIRARRTDSDSMTVLWEWNRQTGKIQSRALTYEEVDIITILRSATALYGLKPHDFGVRQIYLISRLEKMIYDSGMNTDKLLKSSDSQQILKDFKPEELELALVHCMNKRLMVPGVAAAVMLGQCGKEELLTSPFYRKTSPSALMSYVSVVDGTALYSTAPGIYRSGGLSHTTYAPLVQALNSPSRHLRAAALEAVLRIGPKKPFSGSNYVTSALKWFLASRGDSWLLITCPDEADASLLGERLSLLGPKFQTATTGRETLTYLFNTSDYDIVLLDMRTSKPEVDFLVQQIRHDPRTADVPVVLLAQPDDFTRARALAEKTTHCVWFPRPTNEDDVELLATLIHRVKGPLRINAQTRGKQILRCLQWIISQCQIQEKKPLIPVSGKSAQSGILSEQNLYKDTIYNLSELNKPLVNLLYVPTYNELAATALSMIHTHEAQTALIETASRKSSSGDLRSLCVQSLQKNILRSGILLTTVQIQKQYDIYNSTDEKDVKSREILGKILDILESPTAENPASPTDEKKG